MPGIFSWTHILIIGLVILVVFGGKFKISDVMGDVAKGIKSFKKGMSDEGDDAKTLQASAEEAVNKTKDKVKR